MSAHSMLIFTIADVLHLTLEERAGFISGGENTRITVGPWVLESCYMEARDDFVRETEVAVFCKVRKNLWLYVVSRFRDLKVYVFDAKLASNADPKIKLGFSQRCAEFSKGSEKDTMDQLSKGVVAAFSYDFTTTKWVVYDDADVPAAEISGVDEGPDATCIVESGSSAQAGP